jgi:tetratricopeptide (TPR) repeat protein
VAEQQVSLGDRQRLLEALLEVRGLHEPDRRDRYVSEVEAALGRPLAVPRYPDARHDVWSLLSAILAYSGGLRSLVRVIRASHADSAAVVGVERLVQQLEHGELLTGPDRDALVRLLAGVPGGQLAETYRASGAEPEPDWRGIPAAVRRMESAAPPDSGGGHPLLIFVDRLAHAVGGARALELHRWIDLVAGGLGMSQTEIRRLCVGSRPRPVSGTDPGPAAGAETLETGAGDTDPTATDPTATDPTATDPTATDPSATAGASVRTTKALPRPIQGEEPDEPRLIWGGVPIRNPDFTGREPLLADLGEALHSKSKASVLPQTLHGLGGVGKTQLAVEYVYRNADRYDLVWWISAEQVSRVLASLAALGDRLGLPPSQDLVQTARIVLDALATSSLRWLLVFDNADQPDDVARLVPSAGGHVIITSRNQAWARLGDAIEVDVLRRDESIELLRKRGEGISVPDADRLAEKLGDLPLALEQAATWQAATGMPVAEYLQLFDEHVRELMTEGKPTTYPTTVAALISVAVERLRAEAPAAAQLLELFAYLGAEPVSASLLRRGREADISQPLKRALREPIYLSRTIRELRRYGLAKVDPKQTIQVHRLVQLVVREGLPEELARQSRSNLQNLLASANPGEPDNPATWPVHAEIGPHVLAAGLAEAPAPEARQVALDQIWYLQQRGDNEGSLRLGEQVVAAWRAATGEGLGPDGEQTLLATRHLAQALRAIGEYQRARELADEAYRRLRANPQFGEDHEHTLFTANSIGVDLRIAGDYPAALRVDEENVARHRRVFGEEDQFTLRARNNLASNLRMLGDFAGAYDIDQALVVQWRSSFGENDPRTLFAVANVARDLYGLGRYAEALDLQRRVWPIYRDLLGDRHNYVLLAARTIAIALRKTGQHKEAVDAARDNYRNYHARFGPDHEHTLAATMSYANALRAAGEVSEARGLAREAVSRYEATFGPRHPLTLAAATNLGVVLRALGEWREARALDERTLEALREVLGPEHPYSMCVANNLTNDMVLGHQLNEARELSERTLAVSRRVRGEGHPYTLACATNVAFDLQATHEEEAGQALLDQTIEALGRVLGPEHPETVDAARGKRAECDIEPPPT